MQNITIPSKELPVIANADFIVAGAGSAGVAAAVAAAQEGASCVILEKANCAGGTLTSGLLTSIICMDDHINLLSGGLCEELVQRTAKEMGTQPNHRWFNIHPEAVKLILDEMLCENKIRIFYNMHCCDVLRDGNTIIGVVVSSPQGLGVVKGKFFVDATGDGNLSDLAKVPCEVGNENGEVMAPTLSSLWTGVDFEKTGGRESGLGRTQWMEALKENRTPVAEHHFVGFFRNGKGSGSTNLGHDYGCQPLDPDSYTRACIEGRKQIRLFLKFFQENVPGFEEAELSSTASMLGVRESRRVCGDYMLNVNDYIEQKHFDDEIGCFAYPIDIHASSTDANAQKNVLVELDRTKYNPGEHYGIPYRALLAKDVDNLLLAGRCISTDRAMQSSIRVVPGCMLTGEAAGIAAAMAVKGNCSLREINIRELQKTLSKRGIYLPENLR